MNTTKTINQTPSTSAIETAIRNAAKMLAQGYTLAQHKTLTHLWFVTLPKAPRTYYVVNAMAGFESCDCPQFAHEGICKHQKFVADEIRLLAMEAADEAKQAAIW